MRPKLVEDTAMLDWIMMQCAMLFQDHYLCFLVGMLVLARQRDQTIIIGDDVEVVVVDIRGDKVRLGVTAPRTTSVHRKEVYDAIRRENQSAAQVKPEDLPGFIGPRLPTKPKERPFVKTDAEISNLRIE